MKRKTQEQRSEESARMKALEAEGKSRRQIADDMGCSGAHVTRTLGAVRQWKGRRAEHALESA